MADALIQTAISGTGERDGLDPTDKPVRENRSFSMMMVPT